jgi:hypothetical protein
MNPIEALLCIRPGLLCYTVLLGDDTECIELCMCHKKSVRHLILAQARWVFELRVI